MITSKQIRNRFEERTSKDLGVYTGKKGTYEVKPKKDIYKIDESYGGYRLTKQSKGGTGEKDLSEKYTAKEMDIYLRGLSAGAKIKSKKSNEVFM